MNIPVYKARNILLENVRGQIGDRGMDSPAIRAEAELIIIRDMIRLYPFGFVKEFTQGIFYCLIKPARGYIDWQFGTGKEHYRNPARNISEIEENIFMESGSFTKIMVIFQLIQISFIWIFFAAGIYFLFKLKKKSEIVFLLSILFYFCLMIPGSFADCRFRVPAVPLIMIMAGVGINEMLRKTGKVH